MPKKICIPLSLILLVLVIMMSCVGKAPAPGQSYNKAYHDSIDKIKLDTFITNHPILAGIPINPSKIIKDSSGSGLRYLIVSDTSTQKKYLPNGFSNVTFSYSIRVLGKSGIVDSIPNGVSTGGYNINPLSSTFTGLVQGIEHIHQGGHILLFIPSSIAFQDQAVDLSYTHLDQTVTLYTIPPNSVLVYNLTLTSVLPY